MSAPNCYKCQYRANLSRNAHSSCANKSAVVKGDAHGIKRGWFAHPWNFDPAWLESCDGFEQIKEKP